MRRWVRTFLVLAEVFYAAHVAANGGPMYDAPELTDEVREDALFARPVVGNLKPLRTTGVRLVSEELKITLEPDAKAFVARAEYVLSNIGEPLTVLYGVPLQPLFIECREEGCEGQPEEAYSVDISRVPSAVKIELAGKQVPCRLAVRPGPIWASKKPADLMAWDQESMRGAAAWCVASLRIPTGERVALTLQFEGPVLSSAIVDDWTLLGSRSPGHFTYELFPAGWWSGAPERLSVTVDAGAFPGLVALSKPAGFRWSEDGTRATLELVSPDMEKLRTIEGTVDLARAMEPLDLLRTGDLCRFCESSARSSATLAPQGTASYEASRSVDNDRMTAWCEGAKGPGVGEWIEVTLNWNPPAPNAGDLRCGYGGLLLIPGYAKSASSWVDNGRLRAFRIGPCGSSDAGTVVRLESGRTASRAPGLASTPDRGAVRIEVGDADPIAALRDRETRLLGWDSGKACVRLTILEVEAGKRWQDTCISELRPLVTCRKPRD